MVLEYHYGTRVPGTRVPYLDVWYHGTRVHVYHGTMAIASTTAYQKGAPPILVVTTP
jgi:hypothetical protein